MWALLTVANTHVAGRGASQQGGAQFGGVARILRALGHVADGKQRQYHTCMHALAHRAGKGLQERRAAMRGSAAQCQHIHDADRLSAIRGGNCRHLPAARHTTLLPASQRNAPRRGSAGDPSRGGGAMIRAGTTWLIASCSSAIAEACPVPCVD